MKKIQTGLPPDPNRGWSTMWNVLWTAISSLVRFIMLIFLFILGAIAWTLEFVISAFRTVIFTQQAFIYIVVCVVIGVLGLITLFNARFFMQTGDLIYECVIYKAEDYTTTYFLRPFVRDYNFMPRVNYTNDVLEYIKDQATPMVDKIRAATNGSESGQEAAALTIDAIWHWVVIDWLESPYKAKPPLWGPNFLVLPFERTIIKGFVMMITDAPFGKFTWTAVEKLLLSFIRGNPITNSCYFQHLKNPMRTEWAFRGCTMFEGPYCTNRSDHMAGTCPGCYTFTDDFIYHTLPYWTSWVTGVFTNLTSETRSLVLSLKAADVCAVLLTGTCMDTPQGCTCYHYNGTALPWWVQPGTFRHLHSLETDTNRTLPELPTCQIVEFCKYPPNPGKCARVDNTMGFSGMNCSLVLNYTTLGRHSCVDMDTADCSTKDWTFWLNQVFLMIASVPQAIGNESGSFLGCLLNFIKAFLGMFFFVFDKNCSAKTVEKIQYVMYYVIWSWTGCSIPIVKLLTPWKLAPIGVGYEQLWNQIGLMWASVIDGSFVTSSKYFCDQVTGPLINCADFATTFDENGCLDITNGTALGEAGFGIVLANVTCAMAGFGRSCHAFDPCDGSLMSPPCPYFANRSCFDVDHIALGEHDPSDFTDCLATLGMGYYSTCSFLDNQRQGVLVPNVTCASLENGCAFRNHKPDGSCYLYDGCHIWQGAFSQNGSCNTGEGLHTYTHDAVWIARNMTVNFTTGLFSIDFLDWHASASQTVKDQTAAVVTVGFSIMDCMLNAFKAMFGFANLLIDGGCSAARSDKVNFIADRIIGDTVGCLHAIDQFLSAIHWPRLAGFWKRTINAFSGMIPHLWHLDLFKADTWYCDQRIYFALVDGQTPWDLWDNGEWAFRGCALFSNGECANVWDICDYENTTMTCTCPACTSPINDLASVLGDFADYVLRKMADMLHLGVIIGDVITLIVTILRSTIDMLLSLTIGWLKNIIGFFMLISLHGCKAPGSAKGIYFVQYFLMWPFTVILNWLIDIMSALGQFLWDLLSLFFNWLISHTHFLDFAYSALVDGTAVAYCFSGDLPGNDTRFWFRQRPPEMDQLYDFPECVNQWPYQKCDLSGCFKEAWTCIKFSNMSADPPTPRNYSWFGKMVKGVQPIVVGVGDIMDFIVCPWVCISNCHHCKGLKKIACFFKCLHRYDYSCIREADYNEQLMAVYNLYDWECDIKCACDNPDYDFGCLLPCYIMHGNETNVNRFPCMTPSNASEYCHGHLNDTHLRRPSHLIAYSWDTQNLLPPPYSKMSFADFWPLPNTPDRELYNMLADWEEDPMPFCTVYSNIIVNTAIIENLICEDVFNCTNVTIPVQVPVEVCSQPVQHSTSETNESSSSETTSTSYGCQIENETVWETVAVNCTQTHADTCNSYQQHMYDKFTAAMDFCENTCTPNSTQNNLWQLRRVRNGCIAFYMMLRNPLDPVEAYTAFQWTSGAVPYTPGSPPSFYPTGPGNYSSSDLFAQNYLHNGGPNGTWWWGHATARKYWTPSGNLWPPVGVYYNYSNPSFVYCQMVPWSQNFFQVTQWYVDKLWDSAWCGIFECSCCHYMKRLMARIMDYASIPDPPLDDSEVNARGQLMKKFCDNDDCGHNHSFCYATPTTPNWYYFAHNAHVYATQIVRGVNVTALIYDVKFYDRCDVVSDSLPADCVLQLPDEIYVTDYHSGVCLNPNETVVEWVCYGLSYPDYNFGSNSLQPEALVCNGETNPYYHNAPYICNSIQGISARTVDTYGDPVTCTLYMPAGNQTGAGQLNGTESIEFTLPDGSTFVSHHALWARDDGMGSNCTYPITGAPAVCVPSQESPLYLYHVCPCAGLAEPLWPLTYLYPYNYINVSWSGYPINNCATYNGPDIIRFPILTYWGAYYKEGQGTPSWHFQAGMWQHSEILHEFLWLMQGPQTIDWSLASDGVWFTTFDTTQYVLSGNSWYPYDSVDHIITVDGHNITIAQQTVCPIGAVDSIYPTYNDLQNSTNTALKAFCGLPNYPLYAEITAKCPAPNAVNTTLVACGCSSSVTLGALTTCSAYHCANETFTPYVNTSTPFTYPTECPADYIDPDILLDEARKKLRDAASADSIGVEKRNRHLETLLASRDTPIKQRVKAVIEMQEERKRLKELELRNTVVASDCFCEGLLAGAESDRDDIMYRLGLTYCEAAKKIYDEDPWKPGAREAYCLAASIQKNRGRSVAEGAKFLVHQVTDTASTMRLAATDFAVKELLKLAEENPDPTPVINNVKSAITQGISTLKTTYSGSVLQLIVNNGWPVYLAEKEAGVTLPEAEHEWVATSLELIYNWTQQEQVHRLGAERASPNRTFRAGRYIVGIGKRDNVAALADVTQKILKGMRDPKWAESQSPTKRMLATAAKVVGSTFWPFGSSSASSNWDKLVKVGAAIKEGMGDLPFNDTEKVIREEQEAPVLTGLKRVFSVAEDRLSMEHWKKWWNKEKPPRKDKTYVFFPGFETFFDGWSASLEKSVVVMRRHWTNSVGKVTGKNSLGTPSYGEDTSTTQSAWDVPLRAAAHGLAPFFTSVFKGLTQGSASQTAKRIGNTILDVLRCHSPEQFNGTAVYNPFCIALPEAWLTWIPYGRVSNPQINWGYQLIIAGHDCIKTDYPSNVSTYWKTYRNNCHDPQLDEGNHPLCPGCDYCERDYDPSQVQFDVFDSDLMLFNYIARLFHLLLAPQFAGGYQEKWYDSVHFLMTLVVVIVVAFIAMFASTLLVQPSEIVAVVAAAIYALIEGFFLHIALAIFIYLYWGWVGFVPYIIVFAVLLVSGGVYFYVDPVGWLADAFRSLAHIPVAGKFIFGSIAARFERFAFGRGPFPQVYITLFWMYISKAAFAALLDFFVAVLLIAPLFMVVVMFFQFLWGTVLLITHAIRGYKMRAMNQQMTYMQKNQAESIQKMKQMERKLRS